MSADGAVFTVEDDLGGSAAPSQKSEAERTPNSFLQGLSASTNLAAPPPQPVPQYGVASGTLPQPQHTAGAAPVSPIFTLNSMANGSAAARNLATMAKERAQNVKSWRDFFALDQFHVPESTTAAQSRISHNTVYFQNNYLIIILLLTVFSLLSNLYLVVVTGISLGGFYYLSTLEESFTVKAGGRDFTLRELNFIWIAICILMLYMASAIPAVMWIAFVSAAIIGLHAAFHNIAIENEFNSV